MVDPTATTKTLYRCAQCEGLFQKECPTHRCTPMRQCPKCNSVKVEKLETEQGD